MKGVTIKANEKVDPEALQVAAKIIALMLDGRADIAECIEGYGSSFAVFPKGAAVTELPEFGFLSGREDIWDRSYDEPGLIFGLGGVRGNPISTASEESLLRDPAYPEQGYWVAVHELGHHLMNLCFTPDDHRAWEGLHRQTLQSDFDWGKGLMINVDEFFAGLTEVYFSVNSRIPKRRLSDFPPGVVDRLEDFYGDLVPEESKSAGYIRYISQSGFPTPWMIAAGRTFNHSTFGYTIDLLPGWRVNQEGPYETLFKHGDSQNIRISYERLPHGENPDEHLLDLAEAQVTGWENWTRNWDESEIKSFDLEALDGQNAYWIRYYGHESQQFCDIDYIQNVRIVSVNGIWYSVVISGMACGSARIPPIVQELEDAMRSFTP